MTWVQWILGGAVVAVLVTYIVIALRNSADDDPPSDGRPW